jgi:polysaccharide chain length determinant protein (PEP-CTERM system associated)
MEQSFDINTYVRPLLRRKWCWVIPIIVCSIGAIIYGLNRPDIYESKCVLIVEQPELINSVLLERRGAPGTQKLLQAVGERMMGWEPVVKVIREVGLDKTISEDDLGGLEKLYDFIIAHTTLNANQNRIEVSHRGTNPELNFKIVDSLVSNFMKQSIKSAQLEAGETMAFIDEDIKRLKRDFNESEKKLRKFEGAHPTELPGGANNKLSKLSAAENELAEIDREIMILQETSRFLEDRKYMVTDKGVQIFTPLGTNISRQIINLEIQIEMLHARYSDEHPEIVIRKNELAQLKEALERESDKVVNEEGNSSVMTEREFSTQLQLRALQTRREETEILIAMLRDSFKDMPDYNQEFYELQRDYNLNKQLYEQRVLQRSRAELVRNISFDTKANPFTIIEPARIPKEPFKINKIRTMVMGLILGAGFGIALVFGLENIDHRFKSIKEVPEYLQVPALGMIPTILTKTDIRRKIRKKIVLASILAVFVITAITVSFVVQPVKDVINDHVTKAIKLVK